MFINKYVTINKHLIARPCSCKITQKQRNMPKNKAGFVSLLTLTLAYTVHEGKNVTYLQ